MTCNRYLQCLLLRYPLPNDPNSFCSCQQSFDCVSPAGIYENLTSISVLDAFGALQPMVNSTIRLPGMLVGCFPLNTVLQSTLECLFNQTCLDLLKSVIYHSSPPLVTPLVNNPTNRFSPNMTVQNIINALLIEDWNGFGDYSAFFDQCQPSFCTYSYISRTSVGGIVAAIIGLFGGLSLATKTAAPIFVSFYRWTKKNNGVMKRLKTRTSGVSVHRKLL